MKRMTVCAVSLIALILTVSCGNKAAQEIIAVTKNSSEKIREEYGKIENTFMLRDAILNSGCMNGEFFLTGYYVQGSMADDLLKSADPIMQPVINNKIGFSFNFISDSKEKAFKYAYKLNNILKTEKETPLINMLFGQKHIEAASPSLLNKTFSIPADQLNKAIALIAPKALPANLTIDLTYDTLKKTTFIKPDAASQKRYDKALNILYKHATIKKDGTAYSVVFNNDDVIKYIAAAVDALKNDSRIKNIWSMYEKVFEKKLKKIEETFQSEIQDKIKDYTFTQELTVENNLITKQTIIAVSGGKEIFRSNFAVKDYDNPIDGMHYAMSFLNLKQNDKGAVDQMSVSFDTEGTVSDTAADIDCTMAMSLTDSSDKQQAIDMDMEWYFYADTLKAKDNFAMGMDMNMASARTDTHKVENMNAGVHAAGSIEKTDGMITYYVDAIMMNMEVPGAGEHRITLDTDAKVVFSKDILKDIEMPEETVKVLETKVSEWNSIKDEITAKLAELSFQLNL